MSDTATQTPEESQQQQTTNGAPPPPPPEVDVAKLQKQLVEFRTNNRKYYNQLQALEGIDPDQVRKDQAELQALKRKLEARDAGVEDEAIEELLRKRHGEEIGKFQTEAETWKAKATDASSKLAEVLLDNSVTMEAKAIEDFVGHAIPDAVELVRKQFEVKDGVAVHKEGRLDENGQALTIGKFLSLTKKQGSEVYRPHWWKATASGGGATGNTGSPEGNTMTRSDFDKLNPAQKAAFMREVNNGKANLVD